MPKRTVMMAVGRTKRAWEQKNRALAARLRIPEAYMKLALFLSRRPGETQKAAAEFLNVSTPAVNQTLREMIAEGYVTKETDGEDRRLTRLTLTEKGTALANRFRKEFEARDRRITLALGEAEEARLIAALDKIYDCIKEADEC